MNLGTILSVLVFTILLMGCVETGVVKENFAGLVVATKTSGCKVNGLYPDFECTPGHVFPRQTLLVNGKGSNSSVIVGDICEVGYTKSVRAVSAKTKEKVYEMYGITLREPYQYEIDHLISLELGGDNDISNLFPEAYAGSCGARRKDVVENLLHKKVCAGEMSLEQAQYDISRNWTKYAEGCEWNPG